MSQPYAMRVGATWEGEGGSSRSGREIRSDMYTEQVRGARAGMQGNGAKPHIRFATPARCT